MSLLPILIWPDPRLRQRSSDIAAAEDVRALASDLLATMYHAQGRGLAAPQVGALLRLFVMDSGWKTGTPQPMVFLNPEIIGQSAEVGSMAEGCLSIPGILAEISRPSQIDLTWLGLDGEARHQTFGGFEARCIQHEIDHLNGTVTLDHLDPATRESLLAQVRE